ncbi:hypothetical protein [Paraburkholderia sp. BCC1886]|uniref:hypothetical protein n=1 Tax=Paraburkholderia sp. BCC1886 TaxID=2562670 RepID=UPI001183ECE7|nr:hypothetical protein [Paraburkholderia sp. BCC1886]
MIHNKAVALDVSTRMLDINRAMDEAISVVQAQCSSEELENFKLAMGEIMYMVFDKALIPIYKEHPDLVPEGQRVSGVTD